MMRRFACLMLVTMAGLFGFAGTSGAASTVDLIWSGSTNTSAVLGGSSIQASSGDTLTLELWVTFGSEGLSIIAQSLSFDDQVQVTGTPTEFGVSTGTVTCTPFPTCFLTAPSLSPLNAGVQGVTPAPPGGTGFVYTFEDATTGNGPTSGTYKVGSVMFLVQSTVATDGVDIQNGFLNALDGAYDNAGNPATINFGQAAVDAFAPEPGTAALLGLGLFGLTLAGRRNRKQ